MKECTLVNECTIYNYNDGTSQTFHILLSKRVEQTVKDKHLIQFHYNRRHFHDISLNYGGMYFNGFCKLLNQVTKCYDVALTKGVEKVNLLNKILNWSFPVYDIGNFFSPNTKTLIDTHPVVQTSCIYHKSNFQQCTAYKALVYGRWLVSNYKTIATFLKRSLIKNGYYKTY
jgi:hypothetical protein